MPIYSLKDGVFDTETTALMGNAFEAVCEQLHFPKNKSVRELVARRIIAAARRGELNPLRLRLAAVVGMCLSVVLSGSEAVQPDAYATTHCRAAIKIGAPAVESENY